MGVSEIRTAGSFRMPRVSSTDNYQSFRRGSELSLGSAEEPRRSDGIPDAEDHASSLPTLPPSPGPRARRRFAEATRLMIRDAHPALTRSPSEHASLPTPPPSPGPGSLLRFSELAIPDGHPAMTRAASDPSPSSESRIRIMWQPPSNFSFKHDFFPSDASAFSSLVFSAGINGEGGRYWNPNSH